MVRQKQWKNVEFIDDRNSIVGKIEDLKTKKAEEKSNM